MDEDDTLGDTDEFLWSRADSRSVGAPLVPVVGHHPVTSLVMSHILLGVPPSRYAVRVRAYSVGGWSPWGERDVTVACIDDDWQDR